MRFFDRDSGAFEYPARVALTDGASLMAYNLGGGTLSVLKKLPPVVSGWDWLGGGVGRVEEEEMMLMMMMVILMMMMMLLLVMGVKYNTNCGSDAIMTKSI